MDAVQMKLRRLRNWFIAWFAVEAVAGTAAAAYVLEGMRYLRWPGHAGRDEHGSHGRGRSSGLGRDAVPGAAGVRRPARPQHLGAPRVARYRLAHSGLGHAERAAVPASSAMVGSMTGLIGGHGSAMTAASLLSNAINLLFWHGRFTRSSSTARCGTRSARRGPRQACSLRGQTLNLRGQTPNVRSLTPKVESLTPTDAVSSGHDTAKCGACRGDHHGPRRHPPAVVAADARRRHCPCRSGRGPARHLRRPAHRGQDRSCRRLRIRLRPGRRPCRRDVQALPGCAREAARFFGPSFLDNDLAMRRVDNLGSRAGPWPRSMALSARCSKASRQASTCTCADNARRCRHGHRDHGRDVLALTHADYPTTWRHPPRAGAAAEVPGRAGGAASGPRGAVDLPAGDPDPADPKAALPMTDPTRWPFQAAGRRVARQSSGQPAPALGEPLLGSHVKVPAGSTSMARRWSLPVLRAGFNDRLGYVQTNNNSDNKDVFALPWTPRTRITTSSRAVLALSSASMSRQTCFATTARSPPSAAPTGALTSVPSSTATRALRLPFGRRGRCLEVVRGFWRLSHARSLHAT